MEAGSGEAPPRAGRATPTRFATDLQLALLCAAGAIMYVGLSVRAPGLPPSVIVAVPFLLVPLVMIRALGKPFELGGLDRGFLGSIAAYAPFAAVAAAGAWASPSFYGTLAGQVAGPALAAAWAADTFFHVGAVDFFTKRVVQSEAWARFGARKALWLQVAVWGAVHVLEWTWLRHVFGDLGAAAYLGAAGVVTGLAYLRWRNVLGLMTGHFLVNAAAAAAAAALYG